MKVGVIFAGVMVAVFGALVFAGVIELGAPTSDSVRAYSKTTGRELAGDAIAPTVFESFSPSQAAKLTGWSLHLRAGSSAARFLRIELVGQTAVLWKSEFGLNIPAGNAWYTFGVADFGGQITPMLYPGLTYTTRVTLTSGAALGWTYDRVDGENLMVVWAIPPSSPPPPTPPPEPTQDSDPTPGGDTSTNECDPSEEDCEPPAPDAGLSLREIIGILLLLIGALIAIVGMFV